MIPRGPGRDRHLSAHRARPAPRGLAAARDWGRLSVASGIPGFGAGADHLFRTPYLGGRVGVSHAVRPAFFTGHGRAPLRHGSADPLGDTRHFAERRLPRSCRLHSTGNPALLRPSVTTEKQGWAGCEQYGFWRLWPSVQGWPLAAIPSRNRPSTARAPGLAPHWCWTATRLPARRWALRPTHWCARPTQPTATDRARRFGVGPVCLNTRMNTAAGRDARGGVLRFSNPKTKD